MLTRAAVEAATCAAGIHSSGHCRGISPRSLFTAPIVGGTKSDAKIMNFAQRCKSDPRHDSIDRRYMTLRGGATTVTPPLAIIGF